MRSSHARLARTTFRVVPEPVVADLVKASRENVLQESSQELNAFQSDGPQVSVAAVFPAEGNVGLIDGQDSCVGDGNAEYVAREVIEHGPVAVAVVLQE